MSDSKNKVSEKQALAENERIKAVRDLIFGEDMAEYQQEFGRIREQIEITRSGADASLKSESAMLVERLDALEHQFTESLSRLKKEMDAGLDRLEGLHNGLVQDRNDLGQALSAIGNKLQK